jgi:oxalate---CoA ligase
METPSTSEPLGALVHRQAHVRGSLPYLLDARSPRVLSYEQLSAVVDEHHHQLRAWGLGPGDRVGLVVADPLMFATWYIAVISFGAWVAPLDPRPIGVGATRERLTSLAVSLVVSDQASPVDGSIRWVCPVAPRTSLMVLDTEEMTTRGGALLSSSGTTGTPKVMALGVEQLLAAAAFIADHHRFEGSDRGFNPLPLWHVNAEVVGLLSTLVAGSSLVLDERFHRTGFWKLVDDLDVTWINAVPAIIARLASLSDGEAPSRRIRFVRSASAPLAPTLFERFEADIAIPVIQTYGMTEAASQICATPLDQERKAGSVGVPVGVEVRVCDNGSGVGAIEVKGPTVIRQYESPGYEGRFDEEGWLRTGDVGYFDADHYLFLVGRDDDVINRGGEKIYPIEIERALASIRGVDGVAVVARDDDVFGQVPVAFVEPTADVTLGSSAELAALVARVRRHTGEYLPPSHRPVVVAVVLKLPTHVTGKIQSSRLRQGDVAVVYEERL